MRSRRRPISDISNPQSAIRNEVLPPLDRRACDRAQVGMRSRDGAFPFRPVEHLRLAVSLDGLHISGARMPHAQGEPRLVQRARLGIVVDGDKRLPVEPYPGEQRMGFDGGKIGRIEFKFKLELSWLGLGPSDNATHHHNPDTSRQLSQRALKLSWLKKLNLAGKPSSNCHRRSRATAQTRGGA